VHNLMVDAKTTHRWYFVIAMGRKAGHLALGIGKAAGATLSLIPEEFTGEQARLKTITDTLVGAIIKRLADGRQDGVAVLAEGLVEILPESDLKELAVVERDAHDHIRIAEINFGDIVKGSVQRRLGELGIKATVVPKNIGYEVRCADPIPFDMEYTRDLGYCAARFIIDGGTESLISIQDGRFRPIPFRDIMDPQTGRMRVRMVDIDSDRYRIARSYMLRLKREDFDDERELARLAAVAHVTPEEFKRQFRSLVQGEPGPMSMHRISTRPSPR
jgi:6-phosphofructokinase 1